MQDFEKVALKMTLFAFKVSYSISLSCLVAVCYNGVSVMISMFVLLLPIFDGMDYCQKNCANSNPMYVEQHLIKSVDLESHICSYHSLLLFVSHILCYCTFRDQYLQ